MHTQKKTFSFSTALSLLQHTEHRGSSNTKHYVCAFVSQGPVIPRATNRKDPSERMNPRGVSRGCCGWICWCWLAYLSQKAASAVQKRGGWCHMSLSPGSQWWIWAEQCCTKQVCIHQHFISLTYSGLLADLLVSVSWILCRIYQVLSNT